MMNQKHRAEAERLAQRRYTEIIVRDITTESVPIYFGRVIELPGCMGQGLTLANAKLDLQKAKVDYIESLLDDGLSVPDPRQTVYESISALEPPMLLPIIQVTA